MNLEKDIKHEWPFRSDHVVLGIEIKKDIEDKHEEANKRE